MTNATSTIKHTLSMAAMTLFPEPTWMAVACLALAVLRFVAVEGPACATAWRTFFRTNGSPPAAAEP
jgi:hypothetical protein